MAGSDFGVALYPVVPNGLLGVLRNNQIAAA